LSDNRTESPCTAAAPLTSAATPSSSTGTETRPIFFFGLTKKIVKLFFWINSKNNLHKVPAYNTQLDASCMHGSSYRVILLFNNMLGFQVWDDKAIGTAMNKFYKDDLSTMIGAIKRNLTVSCFCAVLCFTASAILYACQFRIQV
jgi:hypothetical protein